LSDLSRIILKTRVVLSAAAAVRGLLTAAPAAAAGLLLLSFLSHSTDMAPWSQAVLRFGFWVMLVGFLLQGFRPLAQFSIKDMSRRWAEQGGLREDDVVIAADLSRPRVEGAAVEGTSAELKQVAFSEILNKIQKKPALQAVPSWPWKKRSGVCALGVAVMVMLTALAPSTFPVGRHLVWPIISTPHAGPPTPPLPVTIDQFSLTITPPSYAQKPAETQSVPEVRALAGSRVALEAQASAGVTKAVLMLPHDQTVEAKIAAGRKLTAEFTLNHEGVYHIQLTPIDGDYADAGPYPLYLLKDQPPKITLLSPAEDLLVGLQEPIALHIDASDDVGLKLIQLEWEGSKSGKTPLFTYPSPPPQALVVWEWNLRSAGFSTGDVIRYRVGAFDANTVFWSRQRLFPMENHGNYQLSPKPRGDGADS
jgi:hypothetical protein